LKEICTNINNLQITSKCSPKMCKANTWACVSTYFILSNASWHSTIQLYLESFQVRLVRGTIRVELYLWIQCLKLLHIPKYKRNCPTSRGIVHFITILVLGWSILSPFLPTTWPKKHSLFFAEWHLDDFAYNQCLQRILKTLLMWAKCKSPTLGAHGFCVGVSPIWCPHLPLTLKTHKNVGLIFASLIQKYKKMKVEVMLTLS
jgi:hypothetical protein